jgi:hypothetical protein
MNNITQQDDDISFIVKDMMMNSDHRFHYLLEEQFRRDKELMAYDSYSKMYKVKYVYRLSQK